MVFIHQLLEENNIDINELQNNDKEALLIWNGISHSEEIKVKVKQLMSKKNEDNNKQMDYNKEALSDSN